MTDKQFKILNGKMNLIVSLIKQSTTLTVPKDICNYCHDSEGVVWANHTGCHICNPLQSRSGGW